MSHYNICIADQKAHPNLVEIWERSVRSSHKFLTEDDIQEIKGKLLDTYFPNVNIYTISDESAPAGFIGIKDDKIEMLFIDTAYQRKGLGSLLIDFAIKHGAKHVDVNEQNPNALSFYRNKGFHITNREETDESARPFPILHLSL